MKLTPQSLTSQAISSTTRSGDMARNFLPNGWSAADVQKVQRKGQPREVIIEPQRSLLASTQVGRVGLNRFVGKR